MQTPWGCPMLVSRSDAVGAGIARTGVHELAVSEAIWRLAEGDELAVDVGANLGYFTGLLARRANEVVALEPNPRLYRLIAGNIQRWDVAGKITLDTRAASDRTGTARLSLPANYENNHGIATLESLGDGASYEVPTVQLDDVIAGRAVGVLKLDVEGHEPLVLRGARRSLGAIRDVVFEHHGDIRSPVFETLESAGFTITRIEQSLTRPLLVAPDRAPRGWDAPTYLATREPARASRLLAPRGWRCLR